MPQYPSYQHQNTYIYIGKVQNAYATIFLLNLQTFLNYLRDKNPKIRCKTNTTTFDLEHVQACQNTIVQSAQIITFWAEIYSEYTARMVYNTL